jgi:type II secretory pathway component PulK
MKPRGRVGQSSKVDGSVLVIVLWVAFGLVSIALYFANTMSFELRAADNRVAATQAEEAIAGAVCYVSNILYNATYQGTLPDITTYPREAVQVGDAMFWLLGRSDLQSQSQADQPPYFSLVDEGSKLNLNSATAEMLQFLPRMTPELAGAIADWRDTDSDVNSLGGAETEMYQRLNPPYQCKNANYETVDELRLVIGMDVELLYGEDANLNGVLDMNENDGEQSFPLDNRDSRLDPGLFEYLTVYSKEPTTRTNGSARVSVTNLTELVSLITEKLGQDKATQIQSQLTGGTGGGGGGGRGGAAAGGGGGGAAAATTITANSLLEFYIKSGMSAVDFAEIEADLMVGTNTTGLVNVNTASEMVLSCVPGIGIDNAPALVSYRRSNRSSLQSNPSMAWVAEVLAQTNAIQAGPYLTGHSYQFTADIAALGHFGRGYRRAKVVFDTSQGTPRVIFRQDLTHLGWALGRQVREDLPTLATTRR